MVLFAGIGLAPLFGQTMTITGIVTSSIDEHGPLSGATVQLRGTSTGSITDVNGNYSITVPLDATSLIFSFAVTNDLRNLVRDPVYNLTCKVSYHTFNITNCQCITRIYQPYNRF